MTHPDATILRAAYAVDGRKIAVTGAGGFIGSAVVRTLASQGACLRALVGAPGQAVLPPPPQVPSLQADILDSEALLTLFSGCETVVHIAGPPSVAMSFETPIEYARVHVLGTCAVAAACRKSGVQRLVYLSSAEVYGQGGPDPVDEANPVNPRSPYGAAKAAAEVFVTEFSLRGRCDAVILRPFSVYGPRMSSQSVMSTILRQASMAEPIVLQDLTPMRDYCHVADIAVAVMAACSVPLCGLQILNAGTGHGTTVKELASLILELMGLRLPVVESKDRKRPVTAEISRLIADPSRARAVLGWSATISLSEGIPQLIRSAQI
jgi:nucleoside-diphosphate-sugar epimerase